MARTRRRRRGRKLFVLGVIGAAVAALREKQLRSNEERFFSSR